MLAAARDRSKWSFFTDHLSVNVRAVGKIAFKTLLWVLPLAVIQFLLYPVLLGDSVTSWLTFWLYLSGGVILPGTLLILFLMPWRADWLTWLAIGWAAGHALELVSFQLAKIAGATPLFLLWVCVVYALVIVRRRSWQDKIIPLKQPRLAAALLGVVLLIASLHYYLLNLMELSALPSYISDVWFHINNAHFFRDHLVFQDPRLFGEPMNYHVFGYAPMAAASVVTGSSVALLLAQYSGLSLVFLVSLLLFNAGRVLFQHRPAVGAVCALLMVYPLDVPALISEHLGFGTSVMLGGMYLSTTTLVGYVYVAALLLPLYWLYEGRDGFWLRGWLVGLFAFAAAGSKSMTGPMLICGAASVLVWRLVALKRLDVRSLIPLALISGCVAPITASLIWGDNSYAFSIEFSFADFATMTPYHQALSPSAEAPWLQALWIFGFAFLFIVGSLAFLWKRRREALSSYVIFILGMGSAGVAAGLSLVMSGASQLFFLYYGLLGVATIASGGLVDFVKWLTSRRAALVVTVAIAIGAVWLAQAAFPNSFNLVNRSVASLFQVRQTNRWANPSDAIVESLPPVYSDVDGRMYQSRLQFTPDIRAGLEWARLNLPDVTVFAVNVYNASPYAGLSEQQAYFETTHYHLTTHLARSRQGAQLEQAYFRDRIAILQSLQAGEPEALERMRQAGITYLYVDRVNGFPVADLPGLPAPVYDSADISIYDLQR